MIKKSSYLNVNKNTLPKAEKHSSEEFWCELKTKYTNEENELFVEFACRLCACTLAARPDRTLTFALCRLGQVPACTQ